MRDLGTLRRKSITGDQRPGVGCPGLSTKSKPEQFTPSAVRWLSRYPKSEWARDVMVDTVPAD